MWEAGGVGPLLLYRRVDVKGGVGSGGHTTATVTLSLTGLWQRWSKKRRCGEKREVE